MALCFFPLSDDTHGTELWKSDGTEAGTVLVKDIRPGLTPHYNSSYPYAVAIVDGTLFFRADGVNGYQGHVLWKSDGTEAGTVLVKNIWSVEGIVVDGTLYFGAGDGVHGFELWKSDGTEAGTVLVKDIFPGSSPTPYGTVANGSGPEQLTNVNGTLFFTANDGVNGRKLWKSDGTEAGTVLVKNIAPGSYASNPYALTTVNGTLFFLARDSDRVSSGGLWKSDGTEAGTVLVKHFQWGFRLTTPSERLTAVNGTLFFGAGDAQHGLELWQSDGTTAGTVMVADLNPGRAGSYPKSITNADGKLYFAADDGTHGVELWTLSVDTPISRGDFNADTRYDCADVDALVEAIHAAAHDAAFDLTGDTIVNRDDLDAWLAEAARANGFGLPYVRGDATLDGEVNALDLNIVGLNWQQPVRGWCRGDFDANGVVNASDLNQLAINWRSRIAAAADPRPDGDVHVEPGQAANSRTPRAPLAAGAPVAAAVLSSDERLSVSLRMTTSWNHSAHSIVAEHLTATDAAPGETRASLRQRNKICSAREVVRRINDLALVEVVDENVRATMR